MTPDIQRAALRAAAKLALSAAVPAFVFACAGADGSSSNDTTATDTSQEDLKSGHSKTVDKYCKANHPDETTAQCCEAEVADAHFPTQLSPGPKPDTRVDALTRGCCTVLAQESSKNTGLEWPRTECCAAIGWSAAVSCTPWGPPVPPAMKKRPRLVA